MASNSEITELNDQSCVARYRRVINIVKLCARICGADVTDPNYRINAVTYVLIILLANFFGCSVYTIYVTVIKEGHYTDVLQALCFISVGAMDVVKFICFITKRVMVREAQTFLDNTYMEYEKKGGSYQKVLLNSIAMTMGGIKAFAVIYIIVVMACSGFPIVYRAFYDEKILIMHFLLPGIDPSTDTGYNLLFALHVVCLCLGAFGNFASDMYLFTFIGNVPLLKNILRCKFEDINGLFEQNVQSTVAQVKEAMFDIVLWHKEYLRILFCTEQIFYPIILANVSSSALSIVCSLYCMVIGVWPAAPFFLIFSAANLYLFCGLGTVVDNSNDDCTEIIYTACNWYNLPLSEQRVLLLMLCKSQYTDSLSVGNMMPLTVGTALDITKSVYSMLMLLMKSRD